MRNGALDSITGEWMHRCESRVRGTATDALHRADAAQ
jgi:hypothetical protein